MNWNRKDKQPSPFQWRPLIRDMFPDEYMEDDDNVFERVKQFWDIDPGLILPMPLFDVTCPMSGHRMSEGGIQARIWNFHMRGPESAYPHRCDISFKCRHCSYVMTFGIVVPEDMFAKAKRKSGYSWREAHGIILVQLDTKKKLEATT